MEHSKFKSVKDLHTLLIHIHTEKRTSKDPLIFAWYDYQV